MDNLSQILIREARLDDEAELLRMMRHLAGQEPGATMFDEPAARTAFRQFLSLPEFGGIWLLCEGQKPAGYAVLTMGFSFEFHGHDAFIDELYIAPEYRQKGLGRKAVEFLTERACERGVNALHLEVDPGNAPALKLYRRSGFTDHGRFLMTKWLNAKKVEP